MSIAGHLDLCGPDLIEGWLLISNTGTTKPTLEIYVGEKLLGGCVAERYREDLAAAGLADGKCGFSFAVTDESSRLDFANTKVRITDSPVYLLPDKATVVARKPPTNKSAPQK